MFQYIAAGAGAVALILGITALVQHNTIEDLEAEQAVLESRVADKDSTIAEQDKSIEAMIAAAAAAGEKIEAAGDRIDTLNTELAAARSRRNAKVETDYALPDCKALLAVDLAAVCPAHAQRLRDAASRISRPDG